VRAALTAIHEKCQNLSTVKVRFDECSNVKGTQRFTDKQQITEYLQSEVKFTETKQSGMGLFSK